MTPDQWERMSWDARRRYLRTLTARENWCRKEMHRLTSLRNQVAAAQPERQPPFDPAAGLEEARHLHSLITPDTPQEIAIRQHELSQLTA